MEMTDLQFRILDCLYFVEPFPRIVEEVSEPPAVVADELKTMIHRRWVQVFIFDEQKNDYFPSPTHDVDHFERYAFLATKEGLLRHNGR